MRWVVEGDKTLRDEIGVGGLGVRVLGREIVVGSIEEIAIAGDRSIDRSIESFFFVLGAEFE